MLDIGTTGLSDHFAAATETETLLRDIKAYRRQLQKCSKSDNLALATLTTLAAEITGECVKIVENQQRQDIQMAEQAAMIAAQEKRLAALEKEIMPKVLDKNAPKP